MGAEYFNCDYCKETTCDCSPNQTFNIVDWGEFTVCPNCIDEFGNLLELDEPLEIPIIIKNKQTEELKIFKNFSLFASGIGIDDNSDEDEHEFKYSDDNKYLFGIDHGLTIIWKDSLSAVRDFVFAIPKHSKQKYYSAGKGFLEFQKQKFASKKRKLDEYKSAIKQTEKRFIIHSKID